jgi:hypothetical protein
VGLSVELVQGDPLNTTIRMETAFPDDQVYGALAGARKQAMQSDYCNKEQLTLHRIIWTPSWPVASGL